MSRPFGASISPSRRGGVRLPRPERRRQVDDHRHGARLGPADRGNGARTRTGRHDRRRGDPQADRRAPRRIRGVRPTHGAATRRVRGPLEGGGRRPGRPPRPRGPPRRRRPQGRRLLEGDAPAARARDGARGRSRPAHPRRALLRTGSGGREGDARDRSGRGRPRRDRLLLLAHPRTGRGGLRPRRHSPRGGARNRRLRGGPPRGRRRRGDAGDRDQWRRRGRRGRCGQHGQRGHRGDPRSRRREPRQPRRRHARRELCRRREDAGHRRLRGRRHRRRRLPYPRGVAGGPLLGVHGGRRAGCGRWRSG